MSRNANTIPFAEWAPDRSELSGTAQEAKGVISQSGHYAPLQSLSAYKAATALPNRCIGAYGFWSSRGNANIFMGDSGNLYRLVNRVPTIISKTGGYAASVPDGWEMEQFGDFVIAVNANASPQVYEMGAASLFSDLGGSPPLAKTVFRVSNQLCLANNRTLSVSGFNNSTLWDYATATQGVQVDVDQRGGNIQTGVGGEIGLIFQERGIVRMTYVGPPTVYALETIEWKHGAISRKAVSQYGRQTFFVSETGMFVTDGLTVTPIGHNRVDKYFSDNLNYSARSRVTSAIDFARKLWIVGFPTGGNADPTELLIYSMSDNRWTHDDIATQMLFEMPIEGISLDDTAGITTLEGTTDVDQITTSVDDAQWRESRVQIGAVDSSRILSTFSGTNRAATIETTDFEPVPLKQTLIDEIWPEIDSVPANVTASVKAVDRLAGTTATTTVAMNALGFVPVRLSTRYLRVGIDVASASTWTEATGIKWRGSPAGER